VMVKFMPGADLNSALKGFAVLDNVDEAAASVLREKPAQLESRAAVFDPQFNLTFSSSCVDMNGLGDSTHVVGSLKDKTGRRLAVLEGSADVDGYLYKCFRGSYTYVMPGYKVTFNLYDTVGALLGIYSINAPAINVTSFDKAKSILRVKGPARKPYTIWWYHPNLDATQTYINTKKTGTLSSAGTAAVDFGTTKFRGGDDFYIYVDASPAFNFERWFTIPYYYCELGDNYCGMYGMPLQPAMLTITHSGVMHTFTGKFSYSGYFGGSLVDASGLPIFLKAGDKVSGTGLALYKLPALTTSINYTTDMVSGKAPANKYFYVEVYDFYNGRWYYVWASSNGASVYSADFSSQLNMVDSSAYPTEVNFVDKATGNITYLYTSYGP